LLVECGAELVKGTHNGRTGTAVNLPVGRMFDFEKFAELIVREMCQVMKAEGEQFSLDQNFDAVKGVGRCMRRVKEHFGVK
jgi:hypothetical protein